MTKISTLPNIPNADMSAIDTYSAPLILTDTVHISSSSDQLFYTEAFTLPAVLSTRSGRFHCHKPEVKKYTQCDI